MSSPSGETAAPTVTEQNEIGVGDELARIVGREHGGWPRFIETVPEHGYRFVAPAHPDRV